MRLDELLRPASPDVFVRDHWEQRPLLVTDRDREHYRGLFSLADFDDFLSRRSLHPSAVRLIRDGRGITGDSIGLRPGLSRQAALDVLLAQYRRGATIGLQSVDRVFEPVGSLCRTLASQFSARFQVNAYLTPPAAQGFDTHYDTHDVFVLQIAGAKRWSVFEAPIELPLREQPHRGDTQLRAFEERVELAAELTPGELLYIPRGFPHRAVPGDETSLHLAVGVHSIRWADVIEAAVPACAEEDVRFRRSLPFGFAASEAMEQQAAQQLSELMHALAANVDAASAIGYAADAVALDQLPVSAGRLLDLEAEARVSGDTRVQRRAEMACEITTDAERIHLHFGGKVVSLPGFAAAEVRHLVDSDEATAATLPGAVDEHGRIVLVRRLVREGLLTVCR
jgi:ribosomal protein L16 Arg81 hydroxylase